MQEEIENKTLSLIINTSKFTERTLATAFAKALKLGWNKAKEHYQAKPQGRQSVKQLIGQNQGVEQTALADRQEGKAFERYARQYGVDYAIHKGTSDSGKTRYLVFFNTEPSFIGNVIPGICASLEEKRANGADISDEMINGLRTGLMGPLAGVGDSLAGGIIYPIGVSIGCSMALNNHSFFGPVFFFVLFTGIMLILGRFLYNMGYKQGGSSIMHILGEGKYSITKLTDAFSILGLMVIGAMGSTNVLVYTPLTFNIGQTSVVLQSVLDGLIPNLLPVAVIFGVAALLKRKVNAALVVLILVAVAFLGYFLGILGVA